MKKILLIEDDIIMRENTAEILALAHYDVTTASNGKNGCMLAKELRPDLIVCDIMMPEIDGYGVLNVLSKDPATASIPFIFLTAKAEKSEWRKGMELGADDYLTKPFDDTELINAIEARVNKSELLKKEFSRNINGLNHFFEQAGGLKELENLSKNRPISTYKKKDVIFHEGDIPQYLYFLDKGKIKTFKTHEDGKEYITNIIKEGDFFGHVSLFENKNYTDSCIVLEKSEVYKIPKEDFLALLYKNSDVANRFIKMLSNQIEGQEIKLLRLAYDSVRKRTAGSLIQLEKHYPRNKDGKSCILVTREDLARITGTATETVIRCLSEFKDDQLIDINGREIIILDRPGLQRIQ